MNDSERLSLDPVKRFHQISNNLVADFDPAFVQQNRDIEERQRVPHILHHRPEGDLRRGFETVEWAASGHPKRVGRPMIDLKAIYSDKHSTNS